MPTAARWMAIGLLATLAASGVGRSHAADPQPYTVTLKPTGDGALDAALQGSATLISLQKSAPVGGFALTERARQDSLRFLTALHSFGYYKAKVVTTIAGHPLDDLNLPGIIDDAPANPPVPIVATFDLGPRFRLGKVSIAGEVPPDVPGHLDLESGQPAMAADVLAAQGRLLAALRADGYPMAKVPVPLALLHPDQDLLDVEFQPDTGPKADIGPITFSGLKDMNESFVRKRLLLHQGEQYNPQTIEKARADLSSIGVFSVVRAVPADSLDPEALLAALRAGHSYASQGPEIHAIAIDGEDVVVECSPASSVILLGRATATAVVFGSELRQARLKLDCLKPGGYGRIVVTDAAGRRAWSSPFWPAEAG